MFDLVRFTERNPEGRASREQHNSSVALLRFPCTQVMSVLHILNKRTVFGNSRSHLREAHTQSVPCVTETGNVSRKLALNLFYLPFECLDSLVCLSGELLGRLQIELAEVPFIQVKLLHQLLAFTATPCFSHRPIFDSRSQYYAFVTYASSG